MTKISKKKSPCFARRDPFSDLIAWDAKNLLPTFNLNLSSSFALLFAQFLKKPHELALVTNCRHF